MASLWFRLRAITALWTLLALASLDGSVHAQSTFRLRLFAEGDGSGSIQVDPVGEVCSPPCSYDLPAGSQLTVTAVPDAGSLFTSWLGDRCYGALPCPFTLSSDLTISGGFGLPDSFAVSYSLPGSGDTGVSTSSQMQLFFNRTPAAGPAIGMIALQDEGGNAVAVSSVVRASDKRLVVTPAMALSSATSYVLTVPDEAVLDESGNGLASPVALNFTTAVPGAPRLHLAAYPRKVMEGSTTRVSVWFEEPSTQDRTVTLSHTPNGELLGSTEITIPAGEVLGETSLRSRLNHGSTGDVTVTLSAAEPAAGQESFIMEVKNYTSVAGSSLRFQAASVISETDGDGVFESGEIGRVLFEVANFGSSTVCNVVLTFRVLNTSNLSILGGTPYQCSLGCLSAGQSRSCTKDLRADSDLPSGDYYLEVAGSSNVNSFLDQARIQVINRFLPDLSLDVGSITSNPLPAGTVVNLKFTPVHNDHGFVTPPALPAPGLPFFRVWMNVEGESRLLFERVYAPVRGDFEFSQTFNLPITYPVTPGTHAILSSVDPDGLVVESDETNNAGLVRFITVAEPNQAPVLEPIGGPWTVNAETQLCIDVEALDPNGDTLTFAVSPLPAGAALTPTGATSARFCWIPSVAQAGSWNLAFAVSDDASPPLTDSEVVTVEVLNSADLMLTLNADRNPVIAGEPLVLNLSVHNGGPSTARATAVSGATPPEATSVTTSGCAEDPSGLPLCTLGSIPAGGVAGFAIQMEVNAAATGSLHHTATVSSTTPESDPGQETTSLTLPIRAEADLAISKDDGETMARPGQLLTYSIAVANGGPSDAVSAMVSDVFPPELEDCSWTCSPTPGASCTAGPVSGPIADTVALPALASATYTATCTVRADALAGVVNTAAVQVDSPTVDPDPSNDQAVDIDLPEHIFADGFESGDTSAWSATVPPG